jgi:hypothetical protein
VVEKKELATWKEKGTEAVAGEDERDGGSVDPVDGSATGRSMRCASGQDEHGGVSVSVSKDGNFTHGYGYPLVPYPAWAGYGHTFIPMGNTHTLPIKSWVGYEYRLVPVGIPIPYPFTVTCESI